MRAFDTKAPGGYGGAGRAPKGFSGRGPAPLFPLARQPVLE
jgi:hypothetical protein